MAPRSGILRGNETKPRTSSGKRRRKNNEASQIVFYHSAVNLSSALPEGQGKHNADRMSNMSEFPGIEFVEASDLSRLHMGCSIPDELDEFR